MPLIAGIDIGNATTEVALASDDPQARAFVASGIVATTGMKGTRDNIAGTLAALEQALAKTPWSMSDVSRIYLNEAAPVIGDVAMETITETIITESTMIGHNPQTPGGVGVGVGTTIALGRLATLPAAQYGEGGVGLVAIPTTPSISLTPCGGSMRRSTGGSTWWRRSSKRTTACW